MYRLSPMAGGCSVEGVDLNLDRTLGPRVPVTSPEVLRRPLAYLGAMPAAPREYDHSHQSHGKGNVRITLEPGRKNLLRLREWLWFVSGADVCAHNAVNAAVAGSFHLPL
jgi:hypothetical protein